MNVKLNTIPKILAAIAGAIIGFNLPEIAAFLQSLFS